MTGGISFQPGLDMQRQQAQTGGSSRPSANPVQEAIKVLSLRLPKVVGARAVSPAPLLTSQGSGGSRVDSVVNAVMARMFGEGQSAPAPSVPSAAPESMPSFSGDYSSPSAVQTTTSRSPDQSPSPTSSKPRVIVQSPFGYGDTLMSTGPDGRPVNLLGGGGGIGGVFEPPVYVNVPPAPPPQLPQWNTPLWSQPSAPPSPSYWQEQLPSAPEPVFEI